MYHDNELTSLAYDCYWSETFSNTSYILNLSEEPLIATEGIGDMVRSLKDKLIDLITRIINAVKKLLGIEPPVREVEVSEPNRVKAMVILSNFYQQLFNYGKLMLDMGNLCKILYKDRNATDGNTKLEQLSSQMNDIKRSIEDNTGNVPNTFKFDFPQMRKKLDRLVDFDKKVQALLQGLPESSASNKDYNHAYATFRQKISYFNMHITAFTSTLMTVVTTKGEGALLNAKKVYTYQGINVISIPLKDRTCFTYVPTEQEVINKWGDMFVVVNPKFWNELSQPARTFAIEHEVAHIQTLKSGDDAKMNAAERELHSDMVAYMNTGKNINKAIKCLNELMKVSCRLVPGKAVKTKAIYAFRMNSLLESTGNSTKKQNEETPDKEQLQDEVKEPPKDSKMEDMANDTLKKGYDAGKKIQEKSKDKKKPGGFFGNLLDKLS